MEGEGLGFLGAREIEDRAGRENEIERNEGTGEENENRVTNRPLFSLFPFVDPVLMNIRF